MADLAKKSCIPCRGGIPPLTPGECASLLPSLRDWHLVDNHHLEKEWRFPDFATALKFLNRLGAVAEKEQHHPDLKLGWGKVRATLWTHKIDGLTESDFILAAKFDTLN